MILYGNSFSEEPPMLLHLEGGARAKASSTSFALAAKGFGRRSSPAVTFSRVAEHGRGSPTAATVVVFCGCGCEGGGAPLASLCARTAVVSPAFGAGTGAGAGAVGVGVGLAGAGGGGARFGAVRGSVAANAAGDASRTVDGADALGASFISASVSCGAADDEAGAGERSCGDGTAAARGVSSGVAGDGAGLPAAGSCAPSNRDDASADLAEDGRGRDLSGTGEAGEGCCAGGVGERVVAAAAGEGAALSASSPSPEWSGAGAAVSTASAPTPVSCGVATPASAAAELSAPASSRSALPPPHPYTSRRARLTRVSSSSSGSGSTRPRAAERGRSSWLLSPGAAVRAEEGEGKGEGEGEAATATGSDRGSALLGSIDSIETDSNPPPTRGTSASAPLASVSRGALSLAAASSACAGS